MTGVEYGIISALCLTNKVRYVGMQLSFSRLLLRNGDYDEELIRNNYIYGNARGIQASRALIYDHHVLLMVIFSGRLKICIDFQLSDTSITKWKSAK